MSSLVTKTWSGVVTSGASWVSLALFCVVPFLVDCPCSLMKLLYMGIQNASKKWTMPVWNWSLTISQLAIFFEGRLDKYLEV